MTDTAALIEFVYHEARLIDEQRFEEWFDLFTEDARYWMPLTRGQPDGLTHTSLFHEDKLLLKVRIERLKNPHAFSQVPKSHCQHVLQVPHVELVGRDGVTVLRTPFLYVEAQMDEQLMLAGTVWHHLIETADGLKMRLKKVELVNCDAALPGIQLFP